MSGQTFGRLTVISESTKRAKSRDVYWKCKCLCGKVVDINGYSLRSGNTRSCGCLHRELQSKPPGVAMANKMFDSYKRGANRRGIAFRLSKKLFHLMVRGQCHYCGRAAQPLNGIDRVDSSVGYLKHNCVTCCSICNQMKWTFNKDEFLMHVREVYQWNELN
jgi:hypothetical protein